MQVFDQFEFLEFAHAHRAQDPAASIVLILRSAYPWSQI